MRSTVSLQNSTSSYNLSPINFSAHRKIGIKKDSIIKINNNPLNVSTRETLNTLARKINNLNPASGLRAKVIVNNNGCKLRIFTTSGAIKIKDIQGSLAEVLKVNNGKYNKDVIEFCRSGIDQPMNNIIYTRKSTNINHSPLMIMTNLLNTLQKSPCKVAGIKAYKANSPANPIVPPVVNPAIVPPAVNPAIVPPVVNPAIVPPVVNPAIVPPAVNPAIVPPAVNPIVVPPAVNPIVVPPPPVGNPPPQNGFWSTVGTAGKIVINIAKTGWKLLGL